MEQIMFYRQSVDGPAVLLSACFNCKETQTERTLCFTRRVGRDRQFQ